MSGICIVAVGVGVVGNGRAQGGWIEGGRVHAQY